MDQLENNLPPFILVEEVLELIILQLQILITAPLLILVQKF